MKSFVRKNPRSRGEILFYALLFVAFLLCIPLLEKDFLAPIFHKQFVGQEVPISVARVYEPITYSPVVNTCQKICYKPPEKEKVIVKNVETGITRLADLPKKIKNPNSIRISIAEAPSIASDVKWVNGKGVCAKKGDKGHKSKKNPPAHIDRQCCLDPDEIPNPRCLY